MFKYDQYQRDLLVMQLDRWNLVFDVLCQEDSMTTWESLDQQIMHHLEQLNLQLVPQPKHDCSYLNLSWTLFKQARSNQAGISNYIPDMPPHYACTFQHLWGIAWLDPNEKGYSVFIIG